jgi:hypothetical protein
MNDKTNTTEHGPKFAALSAIQIHGKKHCQNNFVLILVQNLNMLSVISTIW